MSSQYNTFPFKTRNSPYCFVKIRSGAFACLISLATRKESASRAVSSTMAHRAMPSKCDPSTNPWVFCTEWGPYWGTLPLKIRVSKDLEGTLNLSRTLPGTAVSTGSQVMSNCDRGLSCVRITCRVQQTRARSSAAATTKKTQTRAEANILKNKTLRICHAKASLRQLSARTAQARPAVCELIDSELSVQNRAEAQQMLRL